MLEICWQQFVEVAYYVPYFLNGFWIVAPKHLLFDGNILSFCHSFDEAEMIHRSAVLLMEFSLRKSFLRSIVLVRLVSGSCCFEILYRIFRDEHNRIFHTFVCFLSVFIQYAFTLDRILAYSQFFL